MTSIVTPAGLPEAAHFAAKEAAHVALWERTHLPVQGDVRDVGSIPGSGRSPGGGQGNPLQYSCLENPMDREVWRATVHRVAESATTEVT